MVGRNARFNIHFGIIFRLFANQSTDLEANLMQGQEGFQQNARIELSFVSERYLSVQAKQ